MSNDESRLDDLFQRYRESCPDLEASANFMPGIWQRIDSRYGFWFVFQRLARTAMSGCAALCLVLIVLNFVSSAPAPHPTETYTDALLAEHSAERTYYTEAIPVLVSGEEAPAASQH